MKADLSLTTPSALHTSEWVEHELVIVKRVAAATGGPREGLGVIMRRATTSGATRGAPGRLWKGGKFLASHAHVVARVTRGPAIELSEVAHAADPRSARRGRTPERTKSERRRPDRVLVDRPPDRSLRAGAAMGSLVAGVPRSAA